MAYADTTGGRRRQAAGSPTGHPKRMSKPVTRHCCDREAVSRLIEHKRLGLRTADGGFSPCRLSLTPWQLDPADWETLVARSQALSRLFGTLADKPAELLRWQLPIGPDAGLLERLFDRVERQRQAGWRPDSLNLMRHDFLMDADGEWRLVESNAIAAGMGPFGQMTAEIQARLPENQGLHFIPNPAIERQTTAMARAARSLAGSRPPVVAFVVEPHEDNVHDQQALKDALADLGARIVTLTLEALRRRAGVGPGNRLVLDGGRSVDLLYFRTGYNLEDYRDLDGNPDRLLAFRGWLEQRRLVVCPSIAQQLATSKWVQMQLSRWSERRLQQAFGLGPSDARHARIALATESMPCPRPDELRDRLDSGRWLLKGPGEGGGNVANGQGSPAAVPPGSILMERLEPTGRPGGCLVHDAALACETDLVAEVGVFTAGPRHDYAGYLVRTKPAGSLEAGVHRGGGMLDALAYASHLMNR